MPLLRSNAEKETLMKYSTFTVVEKTLSKTVETLLRNERLKRLLYYTDPKALDLPKLTPEQSLTVLEKQIKIVPKLEADEDVKPYVILTLDNFVPDGDQTSIFRSCQLGVDILCPYDFWKLDDFKLRPYSIAGEIDAMINKSQISSLGLATFAGAKMLLISPEVGGLTLYYTIETLKDDLQAYPTES